MVSASPRQLLEGQYSVWSVTHEMVRLEEGYVFTIGCRMGTFYHGITKQQRPIETAGRVLP